MKCKIYLPILGIIIFFSTSNAAPTFDIFVPRQYQVTETSQKECIRRFLLQDSPEKYVLDMLFISNNITCAQTLLAAKDFTFFKSGRVHAVGYFTQLDSYLLKLIRRKKGKASIGRMYDDFDSTIQRVVEAERLAQCVTARGYKHIILPKKYLYHIPGKPTEYNDENYAIISQHLKVLNSEENKQLLQKLTYQEHSPLLEELFEFILITGYEDARSANICCIDRDNLIFGIIDTEPLALTVKKEFFVHKNWYKLHVEAALRGLYNFKKYLNDETGLEWKKRIHQFRFEYDPEFTL